MKDAEIYTFWKQWEAINRGYIRKPTFLPVRQIITMYY